MIFGGSSEEARAAFAATKAARNCGIPSAAVVTVPATIASSIRLRPLWASDKHLQSGCWSEFRSRAIASRQAINLSRRIRVPFVVATHRMWGLVAEFERERLALRPPQSL